MEIEALPPELISNIFCKLPGKDLAIVAQTCRKFYEATLIESIWQAKCMEEFGIGPEELEGSSISSFRQLYTIVLYPYGHLLGVWQAQMGPYGGLVKVQMVEGVLRASQHHAPIDPKVYLPLRVKHLFEVRLDEGDGRSELLCLKGRNGPHKLQMLHKSTPPDHQFTVKCCKPENHRSMQNSRGNLADLRMWIQEELGEDDMAGHTHIELLRMKYLKLHEFDSICSFKRLEPPKLTENMPIPPGLFKGTYGGHGIEIIYVTYEDSKLKGIKVTGDPNVPANKVSLEAHLSQPMVLSPSQQQDLATMAGLDLETVRVPPGENPPASQPFHLPIEVHDRGTDLLRRDSGLDLSRCKHRYFGTGLIAMPGFRAAERTPAHFIVFSDDVFAFLWLDLRSLSIYSRVKETFWS